MNRLAAHCRLALAPAAAGERSAVRRSLSLRLVVALAKNATLISQGASANG